MSERNASILIAGFGPFLDVPNNPSEEIAHSVADRMSGAVAVTLPTSYRRSVAHLEAAIQLSNPERLLLLGFSARVPRLRVEVIARNEVTSLTPDIDGDVAEGTIIEGLSPQLAASADLTALEQTLEAAGVSFLVSANAGGYVCNALYMHALAGEARSERPRPCVFIHVGSLTPDSSDEIAEGVRAAVTSLLAED